MFFYFRFYLKKIKNFLGFENLNLKNIGSLKKKVRSSKIITNPKEIDQKQGEMSKIFACGGLKHSFQSPPIWGGYNISSPPNQGFSKTLGGKFGGDIPPNRGGYFRYFGGDELDFIPPKLKNLGGTKNLGGMRQILGGIHQKFGGDGPKFGGDGQNFGVSPPNLGGMKNSVPPKSENLGGTLFPPKFGGGGDFLGGGG